MGENLRAVTKRRVGTELANVRSCQFAEIVKKTIGHEPAWCISMVGELLVGIGYLE
jgi:hypothetical protein